jgi:hypothetical protein
MGYYDNIENKENLFMIFIACIIFIVVLFKNYTYEKYSTIKTKEECEKNGGDWNRVGLGGFEICQIPAKDENKYCEDGSECQSGRCVVLGMRSEQEPTSGKCSKYKNLVGNCFYEIRNGKVDRFMCID